VLVRLLVAVVAGMNVRLLVVVRLMIRLVVLVGWLLVGVLGCLIVVMA